MQTEYFRIEHGNAVWDFDIDGPRVVERDTTVVEFKVEPRRWVIDSELEDSTIESVVTPSQVHYRDPDGSIYGYDRDGILSYQLPY